MRIKKHQEIVESPSHRSVDHADGSTDDAYTSHDSILSELAKK